MVYSQFAYPSFEIPAISKQAKFQATDPDLYPSCRCFIPQCTEPLIDYVLSVQVRVMNNFHA